ncbi:MULTISPECIES: GGDEF domain-containing protein [Colwellia]|uniref:diguanylate cyclase n=1 Tax=Colwellia marinimaniae TaxID=1513592 RepID=A0ABQ0MYP9_9GAMM|nr:MULTISPECIES: GGDEF domain-containing protein [Colwellia]GAW97453.1 GGDEF domain-containing protein [Colwellia marinimaniae]
MHSTVMDNQSQFNSFDLLMMPIALFSGIKKELLFKNKSFDELCNANGSINVVNELVIKLLNEITCIYQGKTEAHLFELEVIRVRQKYIYEFNAYKNNELIIVHVQDVSKLKKTQYLLKSSSAMLEEYSNEMFMLAHTDQLTKTANRRALFTKFNELKNANPTLKCSISILDIDYFKEFNDSYGHEFGDYVLERFCQQIKKIITPMSFFARIGGEEFCLIQHKSDKETSTSNIQKILASIKDMQLDTPTDKTVYISFSAGVSEYGKDGTTLDVLLNNADKALYYAKQHGRSCVIPFSTELFEKRGNVLYTKDVARNSK